MAKLKREMEVSNTDEMKLKDASLEELQKRIKELMKDEVSLEKMDEQSKVRSEHTSVKKIVCI